MDTISLMDSRYSDIPSCPGKLSSPVKFGGSTKGIDKFDGG